MRKQKILEKTHNPNRIHLTERNHNFVINFQKKKKTEEEEEKENENGMQLKMYDIIINCIEKLKKYRKLKSKSVISEPKMNSCGMRNEKRICNII